MMLKNVNKLIITGLLFMCFLVSASYADGVKRPITLATFPCADVVMSFKKFQPLVKYLKEETGLNIRLVIPENPAEFERAIKNEDIDFAFLDPHMYVRFASLFDKGASIRTLTREGATSQAGVIIARKDGNINKLEDLIGKSVMFGPKLSAAKWVAAKSLFEENGINIEKDLKGYSHGGCCEDIAFNVYLKAVDAGVVCDHFLGEHSKRQQELGVDATELIVVCRTKSVPTRVFIARLGINNDVIARINRALLRLDNKKPAHKKILYGAELGGFQRLKREDDNEIRMLIGTKPVE